MPMFADRNKIEFIFLDIKICLINFNSEYLKLLHII
jgi:hypothetical protein